MGGGLEDRGQALWRRVSKLGFGCAESFGLDARMNFLQKRVAKHWHKCDFTFFPQRTYTSLLDRLGHRGLDNLTFPRSVGIRRASLSNEESARWHLGRG